MEISGDELLRSSSEDFVDARKAKTLSKEAGAFPAIIGVDFPNSVVDSGVTVSHIRIRKFYSFGAIRQNWNAITL